MYTVIHDHIAQIDATQWNTLLTSNNPFMRHEFLHGLEQTNCVCPDTGWQPAHIAVYENQQQITLLAAMPCYIKAHSYGEYIFDWAWANAYHQYGVDYYPKLSNAVPFTPATGERWLIKSGHEKTIEAMLLDTIKDLMTERNLSSFHSLFLLPEQSQWLKQNSYLQRQTNQFHWHNQNYQNFDEFISSMNSKKRKNIKRERRRITDNNINYRWFNGDEIKSEHAQRMHNFYLNTIHHYGAQAYLNLAFFEYLSRTFTEHTLFLFAYHEEQIIAGGLYFKSNDTLYGRYWGAAENYHSVHFETCYYQAIEWCIQHKYKRFEAGAQGEHKLARGLVPSSTYSSHWIQHPQFRDAIRHYIDDEQQQMSDYTDQVSQHTPFRKEI